MGLFLFTFSSFPRPIFLSFTWTRTPNRRPAGFRLDVYTVEVRGQGTSVKGENILVACGTRPAHSPEIPFDNSRIVDTDHLHALSALPKEIIVVGAGVVGLEYASFMAVLGADVTLIDKGRPFLSL